MTDEPLVRKKLARIERCVADLALVDASTIETDLVHQRFVEHTLQIAIQGMIDVAAHIVAADGLGEAPTNHALFDRLIRAAWLPEASRASLRAMVGFRNVLVHEYDAVDLAIVRRVVERHADDLVAFVHAVRARLDRG